MLLILQMASPAGAEETLWCRSLGVDQGLSQNFITAIAQDPSGFMWFGTSGGLNRWDGQEVRVFPHRFEDSTSLGDPLVLALHVDRRGRLWVGHAQGLDLFDPATEDFLRLGHRFPPPNGNEAAGFGGIASDQAGRVWLARERGGAIHRWDPQADRAEAWPIPGDTFRQVTALLVDRDDCLWVAWQFNTGLPEPDNWGQQLVGFPRCSGIGGGALPPPARRVVLESRGGQVRQLVEDGLGGIWLRRSAGGLFRFHPADGTIQPFVPDVGVRPPDDLGWVRIHLDSQGLLWALAREADGSAGANGVLYQVDPKTSATRRFALRDRWPRPGTVTPLLNLFVDRYGVAWIGSDTGGLRHADTLSPGFSLHLPAQGGFGGLNNSFVRAICRGRDGTLWVGTPDGLNRVDRQPGSIRYRCPSSEGELPLPNPNVQAILEDSRGHLWIGTQFGLVQWDRSTGRSQLFQWKYGQVEGLGDNGVQVLHEDRRGRLWIGTLGEGLDEWDPVARTFQHYPPRPGDPTTLPHPTVNALYSDSRDRLWIGTGAGLALLESPTHPVRRFQRIADTPGALGSVRILCVRESPSDPEILWVGTGSRGLCELNLRDLACRFLHSGNSGLPDDTVYAILVDGRGRLWMSTNRGLTCLDPARGSFKTYTTEEGLQSAEFNGRAFFQAPDGEMLFGGIGGMNSFHPESIIDNPRPPDVVLTGVRTTAHAAQRPDRATRLISRPGGGPQEMAIAYSHRDVSLDFVALHHGDPSRNRCQYRLDPYDPEWIGPVAGRGARYTNLDPGRYTFRVRAQSSSGVWSGREATVSLVILPPFHGTAWFRALAALGILSMTWGAHRWRTWALRRRHEELEAQVHGRTEELRRALEKVEQQATQLAGLDQAKSRFFANISHELRTPLMLVLGPLHDIRSGILGDIPGEVGHELGVALRNAQRLLELVDQLLTLARFDAGQPEFHPQPMSLNRFLHEHAASFEPLARQHHVEFRPDLPGDDVNGHYDADKLGKVVANLLGNAFKFTPPGGKILLQLAVAPDGWPVLTVEDSGPGIPPGDLPHVFDRFYRGGQDNGAIPGTGLGLAVARECVALHGGQITVANREAGGARFTVRLPPAPDPTPRPGGPGAQPAQPGPSDPPPA